MTVDPACGTLVDETEDPLTVSYRDRQYCFCSAECQTAFERNPAAYVNPLLRSAAPARTPVSFSDLSALLRRFRVLASLALVAILAMALGLILIGWPFGVVLAPLILLAIVAASSRTA